MSRRTGKHALRSSVGFRDGEDHAGVPQTPGSSGFFQPLPSATQFQRGGQRGPFVFSAGREKKGGLWLGFGGLGEKLKSRGNNYDECSKELKRKKKTETKEKRKN